MGASRLVLLVLLAVLAGCGEGPGPMPQADRRAGAIDAPEGRWAQQHHFLPVAETGGGTRLILARTCLPALSGAAARLVVINHGKSPIAAQVAAYAPPACEAEAVRWFLERGFAVILPVRRGYGASGGVMAERYPLCAPGRDYTVGSLEAARDIRAAIGYATALPGIRADGVVVVGQSVGGLGAIALSSLNDARVAAMVNMAGGDGGHLNRVPGAVCEPQSLVRAVGRLGGVGRTPMLWVYTANDSYFAPELAGAMHRAYVAGGGRAQMASLPAWGSDGHMLFTGRGGSGVWGPLVERFLGLRAVAATGSVLARP